MRKSPSLFLITYLKFSWVNTDKCGTYLPWSHIHLLQQDGLNQAWLEDMALRFLCVLSLDRFGDFVSDEVSFGFKV